MTKSLRFDADAIEEIDAATRWYDAQSPGLGLDFITEVRDKLARIRSHPKAAPLARAVTASPRPRQASLRRFPYSIVFIEMHSEILIVALAHASREPGFWRGRV